MKPEAQSQPPQLFTYISSGFTITCIVHNVFTSQVRTVGKIASHSQFSPNIKEQFYQVHCHMGPILGYIAKPAPSYTSCLGSMREFLTGVWIPSTGFKPTSLPEENELLYNLIHFGMSHITQGLSVMFGVPCYRSPPLPTPVTDHFLCLNGQK